MTIRGIGIGQGKMEVLMSAFGGIMISQLHIANFSHRDERHMY